MGCIDTQRNSCDAYKCRSSLVCSVSDLQGTGSSKEHHVSPVQLSNMSNWENVAWPRQCAICRWFTLGTKGGELSISSEVQSLNEHRGNVILLLGKRIHILSALSVRACALAEGVTRGKQVTLLSPLLCVACRAIGDRSSNVCKECMHPLQCVLPSGPITFAVSEGLPSPTSVGTCATDYPGVSSWVTLAKGFGTSSW
jgi:hypothetical protein